MTTGLHTFTHGAAQDSAGDQDDSAIRVVRTVADLAAMLASLPPHMPVRLDPVLRAAPGLSPDRHPQAVLACATRLEDSIRDQHGGSLSALELRACLVAEDGAPVVADAEACEPMQRMTEALDAGDVGSGLRALADALSDAARDVIAEAEAWLPPGSPRCEELRELAGSFRLLATDMRSRLASALDAEMQRAELP